MLQSSLSLSTKCEGVSLVLRAVVTLACGGSEGAQQQQQWWWCTVVVVREHSGAQWWAPMSGDLVGSNPTLSVHS